MVFARSTVNRENYSPGQVFTLKFAGSFSIHIVNGGLSLINHKRLMENQQEFDRNNLHALINNANDLIWSGAQINYFQLPF